MSVRLSKSRFQKGLQCHKALWLSVHAPEHAGPVTEATQWMFDQGAETGRIAHGLFPGGTEITEDHRHTAEAIATTERLVSDGASVLFEPAFRYDNVLVRVDILAPTGNGAWDLYEVKSSTSRKPEHVTDAAVQIYVVEGAGLSVRRAHIVHIDTSYVWEGGPHDLPRLFVIDDVTDESRAMLPRIPQHLKDFQETLAGGEPDVMVGARCRTPYPCDFTHYCHRIFACPHPITALPRLSERALHALLSLDVRCILDIPEDFALLSSYQSDAVRVVKSGAPYIDAAGLRQELSKLEWPVYHLDFETIMPALPLWPHTHPYQTIPFQYSIHVHHEDGSFEPKGYLHAGLDDPRPPLAEQMLADLGTTGSIIHYTRYERQCLDALAASLPHCADAIGAVKARLFDLEPVVKRHTAHPAANGRTSIKTVLPAWCPELSYTDLAIRDGSTASVRYLRSIREPLTEAENESLRASLIEYCALDTFAMVRLLEAMRLHAREHG